MTYQSYIILFCIATPGQPCSLCCLVYSSIHDSIMPSKLKLTSKLAPDSCQVNSLKSAFVGLSASKLSEFIDKNTIISEYNASCQEKGIKCKVTTIKKGEPFINPTNYPTIYQLVHGCSMKPSLDHQYWVSDLSLDNVFVVLIKSSESHTLQMKMLQTFPRSTCYIRRWFMMLSSSGLWVFSSLEN